MTQRMTRSYFLRMLFLTTLITWFAVGPAMYSANPVSRGQRSSWIILVPKGFKGWTCIDFGIAGAPALTREGDTFIVRARIGEILETSTKHNNISFTPEILSEIDGKRQSLPNDVALRMTSSFGSSKHKGERDCALVGTVDDADAAGEAPGSDDCPHAPHPVSEDERSAVTALYKATNGDRWKHHVGWLGPVGTECKWHGVTCHSGLNNEPTVVALDLVGNNLSGVLPEDISKLRNLESFELRDNHLAGRLPEPMIQRWLDDSLQVTADASLLTNVTEIKFESRLVWPGCHYRQVGFRSDGSVTSFEEHCTTNTGGKVISSCEEKNGDLRAETFSKLGWLIEKNGFYDLEPDYSRTVTDSVNEITQVTRDGKTYSVQNYAASGPFKLWEIQRAIEGAETSVYWSKTSTISKCPQIKLPDLHPKK
jgi:hypothetical protein